MPREIVLSQDDAKELSGRIAAPGKYNLVKIEDVSVKPVASGPNAGKDQYVVRFRIEDEGDSKGCTLFDRLPLYAGKAFFKMNQFLKAVGKGGADEETGTKFSIPDEDELVGEYVSLEVVAGEYNGEAKADIKRYIFADDNTTGRAPSKRGGARVGFGKKATDS